MATEVSKFTPDPERQKQVDALVEAVKTIKPGEMLRHREIARITSTVYDTRSYRTTVSSARKRLLSEHQICLRSVRGQGYAHARDYEHFRAGGSKFKAARNAWRAGRKIIKNMDENKISQRILDDRMLVLKLSSVIEEAVITGVRDTIRRIAAAEIRPQIEDKKDRKQES